MSLEIKSENNELKVIYNSICLIHHTNENPFLSAGLGKADFEMYRGNYAIHKEVSELLRLSDFTVLEKESAVRFSKSGGNAVVVKFSVVADNLELSFISEDPSVNRIFLRLSAEKEEAVWGMGEQFSHFNLRGKNYPVWTSEQGVGRNKNTYITYQADALDKAGGDYWWTFYPEPTFVSERKYFLHADTSAYADFNFRNAAYHELEFWEIPKKITIGTASSYIDLVAKVSLLLGRQRELPSWIYDGIILGIQGGTSVCLEKTQKAIAHGVKVAGIWAQDWEGKRITSFGKRLMWNWLWDSELYPNLDTEIKELNKKGIKFLGYINPYVAEGKSLFIEAEAKKYLALNKDGGTYLVDFGEFYAGIVDFTNKAACEWYKGVIQHNMIDFGLSGWMADFGEYLPTDVILHSGESALVMHNEWPSIWARINREAVDESKHANKDEIVYFMRAGYTGSQKYCPLMWAGDQNVDWSKDDGLPSVIPSALSLAMCGMGLHHSDLGGYTTLFGMKRTKELFMRWAEFSAFTPCMRTHEGNRPQDNWQFDSDDETLDHLALMTKIFSALRPYTEEFVKENAELGIPLMRPLFMHYEKDKASYSIETEYLYGRDLLVCPVLEEGAVTRSVHFPSSEWIHLWTDQVYEEGDYKIDAPLGRPPVFYRKGSKYLELFKSLKDIK